MPENADNPHSFFQELKRRKVIRVIIVYAAAAFVILELVSIIAEPFGLPDWTIKLVFVILCIGLIISIILSWIYDIHPEGGIVKTEPAHKVKPENIPKSSKSWRIASYISFVVIVGLVVLNIIPRSDRSEVKEILDKSIAVLPFRNESSDQENTYFINAIMESMLDNLCKIEDLRVISRNSVEQYRNNPKPTPLVAEEMNVSYIIEGSGVKLGNRIVLTIQLIDGKNDQHLWSKQYDREIQKVEDLIDIQSEVAQLVAAEIEAIITTEEKQLIEKIPTANLTAYYFYQRGREELEKYWLGSDNREALGRAEDFYYRALEYDSTFALAYVGLAHVYWNKHESIEILTENYLDSVLILADIALSFDNQLSEAYSIKGSYYRAHNQKEQAINEYDKALRFNPNEWLAYYLKGELYSNDDMVKTLEGYHKAASLHRGPFLPGIYRSLSVAYLFAGFREEYKYYSEEALKLDFDSVEYYLFLASSGNNINTYGMDLESLKKVYAIDSNHTMNLHHLGESYLFLGQYEEALKFYKKLYEIEKAQGSLNYLHMDKLGYLYWQMGYKEEAEYYFNEEINYCNSIIELGRGGWESAYSHFTLASLYASRGEKDKAYENLRIFNQRQIMPSWLITYIKEYPLFESIRDEPEFQQIVRDLEAKYQAEHERVRHWLEENDML